MYKKVQRQKVLNAAREILDLKAQIKAMYERIDHLTEIVGGIVPPGEEIDYPNLQQTVKLVDNFAEKNVAFRVASFHRYEVQVEEY